MNEEKKRKIQLIDILVLIGLTFFVIHFVKGREVMGLSYFWWGMFTFLYYLILCNDEDIKNLKNKKWSKKKD